MPTSYCPKCGGQREALADPETNELVCGECSTVLEESRIVSEVTFAEGANGAAYINGSTVSHDQTHVGSGKFGHQGESRIQTLEKNQARINKVAQRLSIPDHVAASAFQYFKLALHKNFVKGRKSQYVVSACLYVACRLARTTHMLMDFAEVIFVNVYKIGATYLQLLQILPVNDKKKLPMIDPSIYIERFTAQLSFGTQGGKKVRDDANKLAQRMDRDWLVQGRRPAGVAAACILLAARMNNFRRSKAEIVQVAKIAEETVQRRLDEFKTTTAGNLTVADFRNTRIESQADPPAFSKHRIREAMHEEQIARKSLAGEGEENDEFITEMIRDIDRQQVAKNYESGVVGGDSSSSAKKEPQQDDQDSRSNGKRARRSAHVEEEMGQDGAEEEFDEAELRIRDEIEETLRDPGFSEASKAWNVVKKYRERLHENKLNSSVKTWVSEVKNDPDNFSDVDDDEVDSFILTPEEVEVKSQVWMSLHKDYLIEQENKKLKMEAEIKAGTYKPPRKRKRKAKQGGEGDGDQDGVADSVVESTKKMLQGQPRLYSSKINYGAIEQLFSKKPRPDGGGAGGQ